MDRAKSYLASLKYDHKLEETLIAKYLLNFRYTLLLIIAIVAVGAFGYTNLPRRLFPEVKIPIVSVTTVLPGAGPNDVESLVTIPIEDQMVGLEGVKTVGSSSAESFSLITAEFESGVDPDEAKDSVQSAVDSVGDLPDEAQTPRVQKLDFENQPVWTFLVTTSKDQASLMSFAKNLEDKLEKIPSVKVVQVSGTEEQEVQVTLDQNALREFNINPSELSQKIALAASAQPAGSLNTQNSTFAITIDPTLKTVDDLRSLTLNINSRVVRLGDIAEVAIRPKPNIAKTYFANSGTEPTRGVVFSAFKSQSANIDKAVKDIKKEVDNSVSQYPQTFTVTSIVDLSKLIDDQFTDLVKSFRDTVILVMLVLFIFLGIRQSLIVAFVIPLSFLIAFAVMNVMGLTINFLSLFSLILALGLLVDNAIVVVSAVTAYWKANKFTPNQTGLLVLRDFFIPIWSTTLTAVWAFLPILIASGIIGEFIKSISTVVSTTLIASTTITILITLPLMMIFLKPDFPSRVRILLWLILFGAAVGFVALLTQNSPLLFVNVIAAIVLLIVSIRMRRELSAAFTEQLDRLIDSKKLYAKVASYADRGVVDSHALSLKYQRLISSILDSNSAQRKTLIVVVAFSVFSYALVPLGLVKNEFFPKANTDTVNMTVELPAGTSLESAEKESTKVLSQLKDTKGIKFSTAQVGQTISTADFFASQGGSNNILFTSVLVKENSLDVSEDLRTKFASYSTGKLSVVEQTGGPPAGADLQIKLKGEDLDLLDSYADKISKYLENQNSTTNVEKSIKPATSKIVYIPDRVKMTQLGVNEAQVGSQLRTFVSGFTLDSDVNFDGATYDIVFRNSPKVGTPQSLGTITVPSQSGQIPLTSIGKFVLKPNPTKITREDQQRTISVSAGLKQGFTVPAQSAKLGKFADSLNLPEGYSWQTGGVNEENQQSLNSIFQAMIIAFILITATMVLQFGSFRKAFIVLLKIPLAISGVYVVFALTATPLSFPTVIGILALFGITVYQSMLIVDKINRNITTGMRLKQSIVDAAGSRVEPILFSTISTVVGLIPITLSDPIWRGLGGAIIAGLLFSGVIMLLFIPVVYYKMYKGEVS